MRFSHTLPYLPAQAEKGWDWLRGWCSCVCICVLTWYVGVCVCVCVCQSVEVFEDRGTGRSRRLVLSIIFSYQNTSSSSSHQSDRKGSDGVLKKTGWGSYMKPWNKSPKEKESTWHSLITLLFGEACPFPSCVCVCWKRPWPLAKHCQSWSRYLVMVQGKRRGSIHVDLFQSQIGICYRSMACLAFHTSNNAHKHDYSELHFFEYLGTTYYKLTRWLLEMSLYFH